MNAIFGEMPAKLNGVADSRNADSRGTGFAGR